MFWGGVVDLRMLDFPVVLRNIDHNLCFERGLRMVEPNSSWSFMTNLH